MDGGANTSLNLPGRKILQLELTIMGGNTSISVSNATNRMLSFEPAVKVQVDFRRGTYLVAHCYEDEYRRELASVGVKLRWWKSRRK